MTNRLYCGVQLSLAVILLCGCGSEPTNPSPDDAVHLTDADGQVTFLVKGMMERLNIL
jgi:hypothetical protein